MNRQVSIRTVSGMDAISNFSANSGYIDITGRDCTISVGTNKGIIKLLGRGNKLEVKDSLPGSKILVCGEGVSYSGAGTSNQFVTIHPSGTIRATDSGNPTPPLPTQNQNNAQNRTGNSGGGSMDESTGYDVRQPYSNVSHSNNPFDYTHYDPESNPFDEPQNDSQVFFQNQEQYNILQMSQSERQNFQNSGYNRNQQPSSLEDSQRRYLFK